MEGNSYISAAVSGILIPVLGVTLVATVISCEPVNRERGHSFPSDKTYNYEYQIHRMVPDSNIAKVEAYVEKTVKSASFHMTGGDYEDPEDVLAEAKRQAEDLYSTQVEGLNIIKKTDYDDPYNDIFIPFNQLNIQQKQYFYKLR